MSIHLKPKASARVNLAKGRDSASRMLRTAAREMGVELRQLVTPKRKEPGSKALRGQLFVKVPDAETAKRVIARFKALPVTDAAYLKPDAVPPAP